MSVSVCLCVRACLSVRDRIFGTTRPIFTKCSVHVTYGRGLVLLWRRCDMLCTSGFMDGGHIGSYAKVARRRHSAEAQYTRSLGLGYKLCAIIPVADQRTHGTTFRALKVTSQVASPGAESAVYVCLVLIQVTYCIVVCESFEGVQGCRRAVRWRTGRRGAVVGRGARLIQPVCGAAAATSPPTSARLSQRN